MKALGMSILTYILIKCIQNTLISIRNVINHVVTTFKEHYLIKATIFYMSLSPLVIRTCIP